MKHKDQNKSTGKHTCELNQLLIESMNWLKSPKI